MFEASLSKDEKYLTCVGINHAVTIYDTKSLKKIKTIDTDAILTYHAKFFDKYLITSDILGKLAIFSADDYSLIYKEDNYKPKDIEDECKAVGLDIDSKG